ncbi:MAG: hypothetical protein H7Y88_09745 [Phycisphaerales bacterium]|nr:hypothetical protein [Phycisphaerales bacterium]
MADDEAKKKKIQIGVAVGCFAAAGLAYWLMNRESAPEPPPAPSAAAEELATQPIDPAKRAEEPEVTIGLPASGNRALDPDYEQELEEDMPEEDMPEDEEPEEPR